MRTWIVKIRVPGAEGTKSGSESYLVQADSAPEACGVVNEFKGSGDMIGGDCTDTISVRETALVSLVPFKKPK